MLQKYDIVKFTSLLALAAAGGLTFAATATAQGITPCTPADGYAAGLAEYVQEADACLRGASMIQTDIESELLARINTARDAEGLSPLALRDGFTVSARVHALDMAERNYTAHTDPEGRDHLFRLRAIDRQTLIGASGAAVLKTGGGNDGGDLFVLLQEDPQNNANMMNEDFTHIGLGVIRHNGALHTTVVFADVRGELKEPMPVTLAGLTSLRTSIYGSGKDKRSWALRDVASGELMAKGNGRRIASDRLTDVAIAELDIVVEDTRSVYALKGPLLSAR